MSNTVKGWLCAIAGMVTMGVSHLCYSIIIILMASMVAAVGCSAAEGALIFSITAIGSLVASLFIGSLLKVLKTKYVYVIGGILQGALLVTMGYSTNLMLVYVMAFLFGIGNKFCGAMTHQINVTNWFASGRGTISSMGTLVSGLINAIMATVTGVLSSMFGYQTYSLIAGFVLAGIIVVLGLLFVCDAPEKYGMQQIVLKEKEGKKTRTIGADSKVYETAMPISKLLRQPLLWAVLVCPFLMQFACTIYYSNQSLVLGSMGLDVVQISYCVSIVSISQMILVPLFGVLSDVISARKTLIIYCVVGAANMFLFSLTSQMGLIGGMIIAFFYNAGMVNLYFGAVVATPLFGVNKSATITGWCNASVSVAAMIAPVFAAGLYGATGSFVLPLAIAGCCFTVVVILAAIGMSSKARKHLEAADKPYKEADAIAEAVAA